MLTAKIFFVGFREFSKKSYIKSTVCVRFGTWYLPSVYNLLL